MAARNRLFNAISNTLNRAFNAAQPKPRRGHSAKELEGEIAAPSSVGIRRLWTDSAANGLTPERLANILQAAVDGSAHDYLSLAEEMEERDLHYASVLSTRKLALAGLELRVDAYSDDARDVEIADAVREVIASPEFSAMRFDLADALGKGYAVVEMVWDTRTAPWRPVHFIYRDPRFFRFDRDTGQELRLLDDSDPVDGIPLVPHKFIVHFPKLRSGLPIRGGLARLCAVGFMCKAFAWKDWLAFAEIFGMPMRVGTYSRTAKEEDIRKLMQAVANLGTDAAAVISEGTRISFEQAANTQGAAEFFERLARFWDGQISKAVLGQTMTADDGASLAQAKVHNEVRLDLLAADALAEEATLNRDVVRPFVDLNYGPGRYPKLVVVVPEPENTDTLIANVVKLLPSGLEVEMSAIRDKLGLPEPDAGAVLLRAPQPGMLQPALNRALNAARSNSRQSPAFPDQAALEQALDAIDDGTLDAQMADLLQPLIKLAERDPEAALEHIATALPDMDDTALHNTLARVLFVAEVWGRLHA